jgi:propanol-preferring alcohol dehydrogenase
VRVLACGVCRTDVHLWDGSVLPPGADYPLVPGHEVCGRVEEVDGDGGGVAVGDLVVAHLLAPCGACAACRAGTEQRCEQAPVLGIQAPGGLAEQFVWPTGRLVPATGLDPAQAAVLPDAGATAHHALSVAGVPAGGRLCVIGAGGVGTHVLQIARALDPTVRLTAVVRSRASARRLEALDIPVVEGLSGAVKALRAGGPVDAVVDFTGSPEAPPAAVRVLRPGGRLVLGSVTSGDLNLGWIAPFASREITVSGVYCSTLGDLRAVVELARSGALDLSGSVTHRLPLQRAPEAFDLMRDRPAGMVRLVVDTG